MCGLWNICINLIDENRLVMRTRFLVFVSKNKQKQQELYNLIIHENWEISFLGNNSSLHDSTVANVYKVVKVYTLHGDKTKKI